MRVGTRTELKRKWTPQGHRPKAPIHIGYEFIHLFVTIAPFSGKIFAMFLPRLDQDCFALFAKEFDKSFTQKTILIVDRATAHKAELMADTKIELQKLTHRLHRTQSCGAFLQRTPTPTCLQSIQYPKTSGRCRGKSVTNIFP